MSNNNQRISRSPHLNAGNTNPQIFENKKSGKAKLNAGNVNLSISSKEPDEFLYLDKCLLSFKDEEIMFSNFLNEDKIYVDPYIETSIKHIVEKPQDVYKKYKAINFQRKNGSRIARIISNYLEDKNIESNTIYESHASFGDHMIQDRFRAFYYLDVSNHKNNNKQRLIFIMFDPYHLVCPVSFKGKSAEERKKSVYNKNKNNSASIKDHYEKLFVNCKSITL
ncbi:hypothetical protein AKUG0406_01300 [Apilactobacillus kunkeei]|nr:hypothetical protein AKUG0406_01300 [Apilactobacillus kunkeei]CAI2556394.1 hypothetical protein AKUG0403_01300 [Apilactobacillus kunkeei]CAI2556872.1 hypothetical protein AKUG0420_01330 [Apilactobacillus kunkeei]